MSTFIPLSTLQPAFATVKTNGGPFSVCGLSLDDAVKIYFANKQAIDLAIDVMNQKAKNPDAPMTEGMFEVIFTIPGVMIEAIAAAAGSPGPNGCAIVAKIEFPAQLRAVQEILRLTFATTTPEQFLEMIVSMIQAGVSKATEMQKLAGDRAAALDLPAGTSGMQQPANEDPLPLHPDEVKGPATVPLHPDEVKAPAVVPEIAPDPNVKPLSQAEMRRLREKLRDERREQRRAAAEADRVREEAAEDHLSDV